MSSEKNRQWAEGSLKTCDLWTPLGCVHRSSPPPLPSTRFNIQSIGYTIRAHSSVPESLHAVQWLCLRLNEIHTAFFLHMVHSWLSFADEYHDAQNDHGLLILSDCPEDLSHQSPSRIAL